MRIEDTAGSSRAASCAASVLGNGRGGVDSTNDRSTLTTATTPGTRTSTTATRTTTTSATPTGLARSAAGSDAPSFEELVAAYIDCRRHKRNTLNARRFEVELEENLDRLYEDLIAGRYQPGASICFIVMRPKPREVWAAGFRDRVVHHLLYNRIAPRFQRTFIADTCACIPGRGTLYAATRLESKIRSITENWSRPAYYLKCDIANFFVSIHKPTLGALLEAKISEPFWLALTKRVLYHDPRIAAEVQSAPERLALIPPHKSLWAQDPEYGLPIGNLSSQFFANVYLNELDQHAKHTLRARHYGRYVDDFYILDRSPQWLNFARADVEAFLPERLGVRLNPKKTVIQPLERGIDFVGQVVKPWRRSVRRRTRNDALARVARMPEAELFESVNSYFGLFGQAPASHRDRAILANLVRRRGLSVNGALTQAYRR